jgi:hypothetical protein
VQTKLRGEIMTLSPSAIALIAVLIIGYLLAVGIGSLAYFASENANEKTIKR